MTDTFVARFTALARKLFPAMAALVLVLLATAANASEAELIIPDLAKVSFLGMNGHNLLLWGLLICVLGIGFSLVQFSQIRNLPVHKSMLEISELIWETCKTYLIQQGKFLAILWVFIAAIMVVVLQPSDGHLQGLRHRRLQRHRHPRQLLGGVVRHPDEHLRQLADRLRRAEGEAVPDAGDPSQGRDEHRDAPDRRRAGPHAHHPPLRPR